jgi:hypothetical protein
MTKNQIIILLVLVILLYYIYNYNKSHNVKTSADKNEYSEENNYKHITHMKHDVFKQITIDIIPILILGMFTSNELFSLKNIEHTIIGKGLLAVLGMFIYYQIIQPYVANKMPNF